MAIITAPFEIVKTGINNAFVSKEPWQIVTITTSTVLLSVWLYEFIFQEESVMERTKKTFFKLAKLVPSIRLKIDSEMESVRKSLYKDVEERGKALHYITTLPEKGFSKEAIVKLTDENLGLSDYDWAQGKVSGTVYYMSSEINSLITDIYSKSAYTNPLHLDIFPGICKMEAEVVHMTANAFHGGANACGTMTSGGTESILMACKAFRDFAREEKGIKKPEMVLPKTAHSAFDKAAQYFKIKAIYVPVDPVTTQVDINAMEKAISWNTIMLVGSAPNFPYGTMDDIAAISDLGLKYNIPVHVDSCLGGFLTAFMPDAGFPVPICDFRLPGVMSISADTHKYGFTPKGSSVVLYREPKYRHHQYTITTDWPGGVYGSPTVGGSRAGGSIAVCWAVLLRFGKEGYIRATREIIHTSRYIEKGLRSMKGIFVFGQPATSVIAIGSNDFDIYRLSSALLKLGWNLNNLQYPSAIHLAVTYLHTKGGVADQFLSDVKNSLAIILEKPEKRVEGKLAIYGVAQEIPDRSIVRDITRLFLDSMYYIPNNKENKNDNTQ
ncbi:sphingosine-1-phosphate lyase [Agrilus planipennis]|uniref:sphinganine-1-phosphate aldolase n=1 Tax=Agrilus planipennis TaxID=224129 RepID=A0A1W4W7L3_AGRPL|nr:sphingosine-1-phosphate lyase [Agrilus planipennis]